MYYNSAIKFFKNHMKLDFSRILSFHKTYRVFQGVTALGLFKSSSGLSYVWDSLWLGTYSGQLVTLDIFESISDLEHIWESFSHIFESACYLGHIWDCFSLGTYLRLFSTWDIFGIVCNFSQFRHKCVVVVASSKILYQTKSP